MNTILEETIKLVPTNPGCYLYYNKDNEIIYVGKAKNLKRRVYSYFHKQHDSVKTNILVSQIEKLEYIITDSELEALNDMPEQPEIRSFRLMDGEVAFI